ncbi:MAG: hypothetical protein EXR93_07005 [Gemmatimonadetes bacterium]|nr:hypothetical protein [Gemmatimonadota bacterium]
MADQPDWSLATWEGNRRQQHREFLVLSFREKVKVVEHLADVARFFAARRRVRGLAVRERGNAYGTGPNSTPAQ